MAETKKENLPKNPGFMDAFRIFMFFTRRYVLVFYSVLLFAGFFAVLISLVSIFLVFLNLFTEGDAGGELRFTLMVLIFFGVGFQALMAFASIAYNLWNITFQQNDPQKEFPATIERVKLLRLYFSKANFFAKFGAFVIPGLITTAVMVLPLFGVVALMVSFIGIDGPSDIILRNVFIPDSFLVALSVFLINYNYYLETKVVKKS